MYLSYYTIFKLSQKSDADYNTYNCNIFVVVCIIVVITTTLNLCLGVEQSYRFYQVSYLIVYLINLNVREDQIYI